MSQGQFQVEVREPGSPPRRVVVDRGFEVGRACDGINLSDQGVSRRHLKLLPSPLGLSVVDLGSRNGSLLNGLPLQGRASLKHGDIVRLGHTELIALIPRVGRDGPRPPAPRNLHLESFTPLPPPPSPRPMVAPPSAARMVLRRVSTGYEGPPGESAFRSYLELPRHLPRHFWRGIRVISVLAYLALIMAMFIAPAGALFTLFEVIVPLLPACFLFAPGLWRNICPLSSANQSSRVLGITRERTAPAWLAQHGYLVAIALFFLLAGGRLVLFNDNASATGTLLALVIATAFVMGFLFKGKSGWCSSICPLLPIQRLYGQAPLAVIPNSHCQTCLACTKNCYDFKPQIAQQADLHDSEPRWVQARKLFASALPGFILGFFILAGGSQSSRVDTYLTLGVFVACSVGVAFAAEAVLGIPPGLVTALSGALAINIFYWYAAPVLTNSATTITSIDGLAGLRWPIHVVVALATVVWLSRAYWANRRFLVESGRAPEPKRPPDDDSQSTADAAAAEQAEVLFAESEHPVGAETGASLLEIAEANELPIEAGCRMGVCGADPVAILDGASCLSEPEEEERKTLRRLGLAPNTRMACCSRIQEGAVRVSLTPEQGSPEEFETPANYDRSITSVVIIGNGIAGVTAADFVRRGHPDCEIHLLGGESHLLYNRMGISRLVYGRSAMSGLFLLEEQWYADNRITTWLNTVAAELDTVTRRVTLGTGDQLVYDRLILAMGSSSRIPDITGFGLAGNFTLRAAADAAQIRAYAQRQRCRQAVVAGGGLLGLEAAHALRELGLHVTVLERAERLLSRNIDAKASALVHAHFERIGIGVEYRAETSELVGDARIETVRLSDGRALPCDLFLACVGITPNTELAESAGVAVNRGVIVDDRMQTSVPGIFAAGDVAEHDGQVFGLWPVATQQGEVAALNALGGNETVHSERPAMILKGVGLELSAIGRQNPEPGDDVIVEEVPGYASYKKLIVSEGRVVGALVLGHQPEVLATATSAVKKQLLVDSATLSRIRAGDWLALKDAATPAVVMG